MVLICRHKLSSVVLLIFEKYDFSNAYILNLLIIMSLFICLLGKLIKVPKIHVGFFLYLGFWTGRYIRYG